MKVREKDREFHFHIFGNNRNDGPDEITMRSGDVLFILGANGTGKSTLIRHMADYVSTRKHITAHRQIWLNNNLTEINYSNRYKTDWELSRTEQEERRPYRDSLTSLKTQVTIFDLIEQENAHARKITKELSIGNIENAKALADKKSPISLLNEALHLSNLDITISLNEKRGLAVSKADSDKFSIPQLSDGERNAFLLLADIITSKENSLICIDEPERHLHKSLTSALLKTIISLREDCAFIISTHDISLPLEYPNASCLLLRAFNNIPGYWSFDYIKTTKEIEPGFAKTILGSKKKILFVEGDSSSLDVHLYQNLFPELSIEPLGTCSEIEKTVKGLRNSNSHHWVDAYGIIDRDNRTDEECASLLAHGIATLDQYSIESIYYHPVVIEEALIFLHKTLGLDIDHCKSQINKHIIDAISKNKDYLCSLLIEKKVKNSFLNQIPNRNEFNNQSEIILKVDVAAMEKREHDATEKMIHSQDIANLVSRFPIKKTTIPKCVSSNLGLKSTREYESTVRQMIISAEQSKEKIIKIIEPIYNLVYSTK